MGFQGHDGTPLGEAGIWGGAEVLETACAPLECVSSGWTRDARQGPPGPWLPAASANRKTPDGAPGIRPACEARPLDYTSWRTNTSLAPTMRTPIETAHPIGVNIDAGWPLATCIAQFPIDVGESSFTIGRRPPRTGGRNITAKATPATPTVDLTAVPRATVSAM